MPLDEMALEFSIEENALWKRTLVGEVHFREPTVHQNLLSTSLNRIMEITFEDIGVNLRQILFSLPGNGKRIRFWENTW